MVRSVCCCLSRLEHCDICTRAPNLSGGFIVQLLAPKPQELHGTLTVQTSSGYGVVQHLRRQEMAQHQVQSQHQVLLCLYLRQGQHRGLGSWSWGWAWGTESPASCRDRGCAARSSRSRLIWLQPALSCAHPAPEAAPPPAQFSRMDFSNTLLSWSPTAE